MSTRVGIRSMGIRGPGNVRGREREGRAEGLAEGWFHNRDVKINSTAARRSRIMKCSVVSTASAAKKRQQRR